MATIVSYTARPRRLTQALLLASAVVIGVGAYALVGLGRYDELPANLMQYGIGAAVLALVLQIAVMWRTPYADPVILPLVMLLNLLGIAMIESVHAANAIYGVRSSASADRQMLWAILGVVLCAALLIVGCLRELLASGTVFGQTVLHTALLPLAAQPAGGFVLAGVLAAVWCAAANAYTEYKQEEVRRLYAGRKH